MRVSVADTTGSGSRFPLFELEMEAVPRVGDVVVIHRTAETRFCIVKKVVFSLDDPSSPPPTPKRPRTSSVQIQVETYEQSPND